MNVNTALLALISLATVVMAGVQVGVLVMALRAARKVDDLARRFDTEIRPIAANLQVVSADAAKATRLALAQVERADRLLADLAGRVEETVAVVQQMIIAPVREGRALFSAVMGAAAAFRELGVRRRAHPAASPDDDPLFIG